MNELNKAQLDRLHSALEQRKSVLLKQLLDDAESASSLSAPEMESSPSDSASARTLNELVSEATELKMAQLRSVIHALSKFAKANYGFCEKCGEPIGLSRLTARSEARFCINCQSMMEKIRK